MALALGLLTITIATGILATPASAEAAQHRLTVIRGGTGTGTVTSAPAGIECGGGAGCEETFEDGTDVVLTAVSGPGSWTVLWSGCDNLTPEYQCVVDMTKAKEVFAWFGSSGPPDPAENQLLTVIRSGTGTGTVTSAPAGIECGSGADCDATFEDGTDVVLTAVSGPGSWTVLWSGCDNLTLEYECVVHMNATKEVFASFGSSEAPAQHQLTVTTRGTGTGTVTSAPAGIECGSDDSCQDTFDHDTDVVLTPVPGAGTQEIRWSGCESVNLENQCFVDMTVSRAVFATFDLDPPAQRQLTVTNGGSGTVTSAPAGIECGGGSSDCQANFNYGTDVVLTAVSGPGSWPVLWSGCDNLSLASECVVEMIGPREVFAWFGSGGAVTVDPDPSPDPDPSHAPAPAPGPAPGDEAQRRKAEERARQQRALAKKRAKARARCRNLQGKAKARCVRQANLIGKRTSSKRGS